MKSILFALMMLTFCFAEETESSQSFDYEQSELINTVCIAVLVSIIAILVIVLVLIGLLKRKHTSKHAKSSYQSI